MLVKGATGLLQCDDQAGHSYLHVEHKIRLTYWVIFNLSLFTLVVYKQQHGNQDIHMHHYNDVIMTTMASKITSFTVVYSIVYSGADQRKHQSSASLAFVRGIYRDRWIPRTHKGSVTRKMFPFDDVIMKMINICSVISSFLIKHSGNGKKK